LKGGGFADTVLANKTQDLLDTGLWKAVEFEAVPAESVSGFGFESTREIHDLNGVVGTGANAHSAADAQRLGDCGSFLGDADAILARANNRTFGFAFFVAFLWLASSFLDDRKTDLLVSHLPWSNSKRSPSPIVNSTNRQLLF
jgi:hypothetical protein